MSGFDWNNLLELAAARTDFLRLGAGELVYIHGPAEDKAGYHPSCGQAMGQISPKGYYCDTADGAGKDRQSALRRLARSVCADLEEIGEGAAMAIARQACCRQKEILVVAIARQAAEHGLEKVVAGTGEPIIAEGAAFLGWSARPYRGGAEPRYWMSSRLMSWLS